MLTTDLIIWIGIFSAVSMLSKNASVNINFFFFFARQNAGRLYKSRWTYRTYRYFTKKRE